MIINIEVYIKKINSICVYVGRQVEPASLIGNKTYIS